MPEYIASISYGKDSLAMLHVIVDVLGWPFQRGPWCNSRLKRDALDKIKGNGESYIGIAADEPERIAKHINKPNVKLPLVEAGWTEAMFRQWCEDNSLLSPIYTDSARGGCWLWQNQGVDQLRLLRKNYPEYWALMLKWDADSPVTFHPGRRLLDGTYEQGKTVHDYDKRFALEDRGLIPNDRTFKWAMVDDMCLLLGPDYEEDSI